MFNIGWSYAYGNVAGSPSYTGKVADMNYFLEQIKDAFNKMQGYKADFEQKGYNANYHVTGDSNGPPVAETQTGASSSVVTPQSGQAQVIVPGLDDQSLELE